MSSWQERCEDHRWLPIDGNDLKSTPINKPSLLNEYDVEMLGEIPPFCLSHQIKPLLFPSLWLNILFRSKPLREIHQIKEDGTLFKCFFPSPLFRLRSPSAKQNSLILPRFWHQKNTEAERRRFTKQGPIVPKLLVFSSSTYNNTTIPRIEAAALIGWNLATTPAAKRVCVCLDLKLASFPLL